MTNDIRIVVAIVSPEIQYDEVVEKYTARINELGVTGYGDTKEKALSRVKDLYGSWVSAHRYNEDLVEYLDRSGITWCWKEDYIGDLEIEYVATSQGSPEGRSPHRRTSRSDTRKNNSQEYSLAA